MSFIKKKITVQELWDATVCDKCDSSVNIFVDGRFWAVRESWLESQVNCGRLIQTGVNSKGHNEYETESQ